MKEIKHHYLHVDLDAFFASVEQLDHPEYRGKALIVGGLPGEKRAVVSTASYEARKYGVHSAMPVSRAFQLCPDGIFVHGNMKRYSELSYQIMNIFRDFSPDVQQISIDEAFIDLTGTEKLFGPPEETALKIKEEVKKQTGLTVSVGLAPTKYLAKIASDMNKPDGFYQIKEGQEESFMLNLPLKKVWGIGDKTLEALKAAGLRSTRDIHEKTREALVFMFGENTGSFLYNVVRGIETVDFDRKTKSHSISNERTFPYDLSDAYTAETTILELCHSVMFRLLREKSFSKTVMVKIRYEDFTTVSIQQTYSDYVLTLDSLYNRARELFERKYEKGRGIRLIGIALENIDTEQKPSQQSLFDDGTEKKQKVESAILKLETKHPEIKIHKARMLQKIQEGVKALALFLLAGLLFAVNSQRLYALEEKEESGWNISGYWKGDFSAKVETGFGYSNPFTYNFPLPVFKQEVDLSAFVQISPFTYFSMEFLDEFKHNSWTFGYKGKGYLKEFKLSNRGITFPSSYSSSAMGYGLEGGENQAPGMMLSLEDIKNSRWKSDFLIRYDMLKAKSLTFYGNNLVNQTETKLNSYLHSYIFYLPSDVISLIDSVYIQDEYGTYTDSKGIKYTKLAYEDYLILAAERLLIIKNQNESKNNTSSAAPYIIIAFNSDSYCTSLLQATGSYDDPASFAGEVQQYFASSLTGQKNLKPSDFSSLASEDIIRPINGKAGFVIQSPQAFLPFASSGFYPAIQNQEAGYSVIDSITKLQKEDYYVSSYGYSESGQAEAVAILKKESSLDFSKAEVRFPFADLYPELYLYKGSQLPLLLAAETKSPVKNFDIGKFVQAGSVRVYKNGILQSAVYDKGSGFVTLNCAISELDKIYITWYEESNELSAGAFAAAAGFIYNFTPELSFDVSYTGLYPLLQKDDYARVNNPKESFSALTAGLSYNNDFLSISDSLSVAYTNPNIAGKLLVNDWAESSNQTFYLAQNSGQAAAGIPHSSPLFELRARDNFTVNNFAGQKDKKISGYKIPLTYDFSKAGTDQKEKLWASLAIKLDKAEALYKASEFELALMPDQSLAGQNCRVFLILGDIDQVQTLDLPVWELTSLADSNVLIPFDTDKPQWQTVKIHISPQQRARLCGGHDAKIIILKDLYTAGLDNAKAGLFAGPYCLIYPVMQTENGKNIIVQTNVNNKKQAGLEWTITDYTTDEKDKSIICHSYFEAADFSLYKKLSLDILLSSPAEIELSLCDSSFRQALCLKILPLLADRLCDGKSHNLCVNIDEKKLYIDNSLIETALYQLSLDKSIIPSRQTIRLIPKADGSIDQEKQGQLYISGLWYKDSNPALEGKNLAGTKITFKSGEIEAQSEQGVNGSSWSTPYINTAINGFYTLAGIKASADAAFTLKGLGNAGHALETRKTLFNFLDFGEIYRYSPSDAGSSKKDYIKINTKNVYQPFSINLFADTRASKTHELFSSQDFNSGLELQLDLNKSLTSLSAGLNAWQKILNKEIKKSSYFYDWYQSSILEFSTGEKKALRNIKLTAALKSQITLLGLTPQVDYELSGSKKLPEGPDYTCLKQLHFVLPYTGKNHALSFDFTHKDSRLQKYSGSNYGQDLSFIFQNRGNNSLLTMQANLYELNWRRKLFNDLKDFFIPLSASASFTDRKNISGGQTKNDYEIKLNLTDTFINLFGNNSTLQFFSWYRQEEFTNTLNATINFGKNKGTKASYTILDYTKLIFNIKDSDYLEFNSSFNFTGQGLLKVKAGSSWTHQVESSLLLALTKAVWKAAGTMDIKNHLKESFDFSLDKDKKMHRQTYRYFHDSSLEFLNACSVNSGAGIVFGFEEGKSFILSLEYSLGIKINF